MDKKELIAKLLAWRKRFIKNDAKRLPLLKKDVIGFKIVTDYSQLDASCNDFSLNTLVRSNVPLEQKVNFKEHVTLSDFDTTAQVVESILTDDFKKTEKQEKK